MYIFLLFVNKLNKDVNSSYKCSLLFFSIGQRHTVYSHLWTIGPIPFGRANVLFKWLLASIHRSSWLGGEGREIRKGGREWRGAERGGCQAYFKIKQTITFCSNNSFCQFYCFMLCNNRVNNLKWTLFLHRSRASLLCWYCCCYCRWLCN